MSASESPADAPADDRLPSEARFDAAMRHRFFLRLHMTLIVVGTFAVGLFATKLLYAMHVYNMAWRYGISVCLAFGAFVGAIKIWLAYVAWCTSTGRNVRQSSSGGDWLNWVGFNSGGSSSGVIDAGGPSLESGGSSFGGGGAGGSWGGGSSDVVSAPVRATGASDKSSGGGGLDLDFGDDWGLILLVLLLVIGIALAAFYVIYAAPAILSEAGFHAALAASLARRSKHISFGGWVESVFRSTALPFLAVLVLAVGTGWYAQKHCPSATRLRDAFHCVGR